MDEKFLDKNTMDEKSGDENQVQDPYTLYFTVCSHRDKRTSIRNLSRVRSSEFNREKHGHWDASEHDDFRTIFP